MCYLLIALLLAVFPVRAFATTYYVDGAGGNNSNSGTSPTSAWQTVSKVNSVSFSPGDTVLFHGGQTWREEIQPTTLNGSVNNPITFGVYSASSGVAIINGSDLITGWSAVSGDSNPVYQATESTQPHAVYVDGNYQAPTWPLQQACCRDGSSCSPTGTCAIGPMTAGSWYWTGSTLYVWLSGGANPSSHGIEGSTRLAGFFANGGDGSFSYITINGLVFVRGYGYGIRFHDYGTSGVGMKGMTVENCVTTQSGTGKIDGGSYYNQIEFLDETKSSDGAQFINNTASYCGGHGNCIEIQGDTGSPLAAGNDVSNWNHNGIDVKTSSGAMVSGNRMHDQPSIGAGGYVENSSGFQVAAASVTFQNNSVWNASNAFQCEGNSSGCTVTVTCNVNNNIDSTLRIPILYRGQIRAA